MAAPMQSLACQFGMHRACDLLRSGRAPHSHVRAIQGQAPVVVGRNDCGACSCNCIHHGITTNGYADV